MEGITLFDDPLQTMAPPSHKSAGCSYPRQVPHRLRSQLHCNRKCIDVRGGKPHAIKARVGQGCSRSLWVNEVHGPTARIAINPRTPRDNAAVRSGAM